ncbi:hypothetical protein CVV68_00310 [Arthrobacter livingstonensis]|uniref:Plasmid pRiA4b Orf3-like domain-containing protein n=1 Tax=Arthrobacter livingstonensis TaxID=670078 RepID=A0A2V5LHM9_9MICC|nr:plasmid pRiA4b ORF-3 family protein [Arthrobacter livingstonensis]PYI69593.1 hypothetical protein CVV68_00310 [Arthrobacter livingstonensis]
MAKKTKHRPKAARGATSVSALRAERGVDAITPAFVRWVASNHELPAASAMLILEPVKAVAAAYFEASPASDVTSFEPVPFGLALADVLGEVDKENEQVAAYIYEAVHLYLEFLSEADAWTGSDVDFEAIDDLFHEDDDEDGIPDIVAPELTQEEETAGLAGTELARRLNALLQWIGKGKDVTSTGSLRLKDIEGAAAAIGVAAMGAVQSVKKQQDVLSGNDDGGTRAGEPVRTVKAMKDEPKLALFWAALQSAKLIEVGSTRVRLTALAERLLAGEDGFSLTALRNFTADFLKLSMRDEDAWDPWTLQASMAQTAVLVAATTDTPPELERIRTASEAAGSSGVDGLVGQLVLGYLDYLAELGLLTIGTHVQVPPAVVGSVAAAMEDILRFGDEPEYELELPQPEPVTAMRPAAKRKNSRPRANPTDPILQLKVSIQQASPPIWRRLLVRSDVTLGDMHSIIQNSFEWDDSHLHGFQVGGRGGLTYGPPDVESYGPQERDENAYTLGEILPAEGDSMVYTYDFGDDWEHLIKVEKVLPADPNATVVRCTGGRGRGPAEDSGGAWGWANVVEAVSNPSHPEHLDYRDWLGLSRGETFDPKAFDRAELNEHLSHLF